MPCCRAVIHRLFSMSDEKRGKNTRHTGGRGIKLVVFSSKTRLPSVVLPPKNSKGTLTNTTDTPVTVLDLTFWSRKVN